jgi:hypothetical protein
MKTQSEVQDYVKRPGRYSNIDGTGEMVFGVMYLGFALLSYLQSTLPKDSIWKRDWYSLLFMEVVLLAACGLGWWGTKAIKKYITFPRTGYVAYNWAAKCSVVTMVVAGVAGAVVSAALVFAVFYGLRHNAVSPLRIGFLILYGAPYVVFAFMSRDHPWKWFVALFMALGLAAIAFTIPGSLPEQFRPIALFLGLTWLASGGITLYLYMRRTQPPAQDAE